MNFTYLGHMDVKNAVDQLDRYPELWNMINLRTASADSPHREVDDIWVRSCDPAKMTGAPHFATFYPAWKVLTELRPIVFDIMRSVQAVYLGGILITRLKPGKVVYPHDDKGSWHAEYLNTKVYVPLRANDRCVNYCEDESVVMQAGECYEFNNLLEHGVKNEGRSERITLIICMRVEYDMH